MQRTRPFRGEWTGSRKPPNRVQLRKCGVPSEVVFATQTSNPATQTATQNRHSTSSGLRQAINHHPSISTVSLVDTQFNLEPKVFSHR